MSSVKHVVFLLSSVFLFCLEFRSGDADMSCGANDLQALMVRLQKLKTETSNNNRDYSSRLKIIEKEFLNIIDGGWSTWGEWSTCQGGIQSRRRNCSNPAPSKLGKQCLGDRDDVAICNKQKCHCSGGLSDSVTFNADSVTDISPVAGDTMVFSNVLSNLGAAYNSSTGVFTSPKNGTYIFNAQLCISNGAYMQFDIMVGNVSYATAYGYNYYACDCRSLQTAIELERNDDVFVQWNFWSYASTNVVCQGTSYRNYFSGAFIN